MIVQIESIASITIFSFFLSSAEVASSNNKYWGFLRNTQEIAILCFSPPDNLFPYAPTIVSSPFSKLSTKLNAFPNFKAS